MEEIAYRAQNVRETLVELKNTSELAVDLAYAAVFYDYPGLAEEVMELEKRAYSLQYPAKIALMLAAKRTSDAEQLVGIIQIVEAAVSITNAAADIAGIVLNDIGIPMEVRAALPDADEMIMHAVVSKGSDAAGEAIGELAFETETGVSVIAIRRDKEWNIAPNEDSSIETGDTVIGSGPDSGVESVKELLTGERSVAGKVESQDIQELEQASDLVMDLKNISELAVGLGYASTLFDDADLAGEVYELENQSDRIKYEIESLVIEAGEQVTEPSKLRGLLHLAIASEAICDAAASISDIVIREGSVHPVFSKAMGESDEIIMTTNIENESRLDGATLGDLELEEQTGMLVMAIHRDDDWLLAPEGEIGLQSKDILICRGPKEGAESLRNWSRGKD